MALSDAICLDAYIANNKRMTNDYQGYDEDERRREEIENQKTCNDEDEKYLFAEVFAVEGDLIHVAYPTEGGVIYSDKFMYKNYSIEEINKYFCMYLDYIFKELKEDFWEFEWFYQDQVCYDLYNCFEVGNRVLYMLTNGKFDGYRGDEVSYAMLYIDTRVIKDKVENFEEFIRKVYSKFGKQKLVILSSKHFFDGDIVCNANTLDTALNHVVDYTHSIWEDIYCDSGDINDNVSKQEIRDSITVEIL